MLSTWLMALQCPAQHVVRVMHAESGLPVPFAALRVTGGEILKIAGLNGEIEVDGAYPGNLEVYHPSYHTSLLMQVDSVVSLSPLNFAWELPLGDRVAGYELIGRVWEMATVYDPLALPPYRHYKYDKLTLQTSKLQNVNNLLNNYLKITGLGQVSFKEGQNLGFMESYSTYKFRNGLNRREQLLDVFASGLEVPAGVSLSAFVFPYSLYTNFIRLAGQDYLSPANPLSGKFYQFIMEDSVMDEGFKIYRLRFQPSKIRRSNRLKGYLYIDSLSGAITGFEAGPADESNVHIQFFYEFMPVFGGYWYPSGIKSYFTIRRMNRRDVELTAVNESMVVDFVFDDGSVKQNFDEVVVDFDMAPSNVPGSTISEKRVRPLHPADSLALEFYNDLGNVRNINNYLYFGQRLIDGKINFDKLDVDLNKIVALNEHEGLRLGAGFHTNRNLSRFLKMGAYFGYGLKDSKFKYGIDGSIMPLGDDRLELNVSYSDDVEETGAQVFPFGRRIFGAELLRKIRLFIFDRSIRGDLSLSWQVQRYLWMRAGVSSISRDPLYNYQYRDFTGSRYQFTEVYIGGRLGFGEEYLRINRQKFLLSSPFPVLYVNFTKGDRGLLGGQFDYVKIDLRLDFSFRTIGFGQTNIQVTSGRAIGDLPYQALYVMKGGYRNPAPLFHNTFETMGYNEFVTDNNIAMFFSHNFGKLYIPGSKFSPDLEFLHNMGFGTLRHREYHNEITFKTMGMGYFESGLFTNNIVRISVGGVRLGLGLGFFVRYGPYSNPLVEDNVTGKFSIGIGL